MAINPSGKVTDGDFTGTLCFKELSLTFFSSNFHFHWHVFPTKQEHISYDTHDLGGSFTPMALFFLRQDPHTSCGKVG